MATRVSGDWLGWIKFFLLGIELTAKEAIVVSEKRVTLQADMEKLIAASAAACRSSACSMSIQSSMRGA